MKAKKAGGIFMSLVLAMMLMAGGFARFHHHTHDNRACFCLTLDDAIAHAKAHAHDHDGNDCCNHNGGNDCCGLALDDFQILHDDSRFDDGLTTLPMAILPCLTAVIPQDDAGSPICHRCLTPLLSVTHSRSVGLRAPPVI